MKASELRIGNWVNGKHRGEFQVTCENISDLQNGHIELKGIPLTEEWLERMGFKDNEWRHKTDANCMYWGKDRKKLYISDQRDTEYSFIAPCKYVHQLQNLYHSLTGEELTIKEA